MEETNKEYVVVVFQDGERIEIDSTRVRMNDGDTLSFFDNDGVLRAFVQVPTIKYFIAKKREE